MVSDAGRRRGFDRVHGRRLEALGGGTREPVIPSRPGAQGFPMGIGAWWCVSGRTPHADDRGFRAPAGSRRAVSKRLRTRISLPAGLFQGWMAPVGTRFCVALRRAACDRNVVVVGGRERGRHDVSTVRRKGAANAARGRARTSRSPAFARRSTGMAEAPGTAPRSGPRLSRQDGPAGASRRGGADPCGRQGLLGDRGGRQHPRPGIVAVDEDAVDQAVHRTSDGPRLPRFSPWSDSTIRNVVEMAERVARWFALDFGQAVHSR